jgi:hypothetical protein
LNKRRVTVIVCLTLLILAEWVMWEAVVKPLRSCCPNGWDRGFPSPFYVFTAPIWFWHDLSILIVVVCSAILSYLALDYFE